MKFAIGDRVRVKAGLFPCSFFEHAGSTGVVVGYTRFEEKPQVQFDSGLLGPVAYAHTDLDLVKRDLTAYSSEALKAELRRRVKKLEATEKLTMYIVTALTQHAHKLTADQCHRIGVAALEATK